MQRILCTNYAPDLYKTSAQTSCSGVTTSYTGVLTDPEDVNSLVCTKHVTLVRLYQMANTGATHIG